MTEAGKHKATAASQPLLAFILIVVISLAQAGRLLVVPVDGSHWTGVKAVAEELGRRGHSVVVVIPEASLRLGPSKHCTTKVFPVSYTKSTIEAMHSKHMEMFRGNQTFLEWVSVYLKTMSNVIQLMTATVENLLHNEELISYLRDQNFDALLTDPLMPIGVILAEHLGLPTVYILRGFPCELYPSVTGCPSPPSFVPRLLTHYTDRMSFGQRLGNTLLSMLEPLLCKAFFWSFDGLASRILQRDVTVVDMMKGTSLWLIRYDFTFEFPRPLMPNMVLVGGINCAVRSALPKGGKVLVMPVEGSHWLSMRTLVAELSRRGHETVVLVPETSILIGGSAYGRTEVFHVPYNKEDLENNINKLRDNAFGKRPQAMDLLVNVGLLLNFTGMQVRGCKGLLYDELLMNKLRSEGFDVVLTDPFLPCGAILASALNIPVVYFLRGLPCGLEYQAMQCPSPRFFMPRFFTGNSDVMTFPQRLRNMISILMEMQLCRVIYASFDELATEYLGRVTTYKELIAHGAIWLLKYDFIFEFPRLLMPNMVFVGGINCAERNGLPAVSLSR